METDNSSKPTTPLVVIREKLAKIDAELLSCRQRVDDLQLLASLTSSKQDVKEM
jgi:hypothetical protein